MADFNAHISQLKSNIQFLEELNRFDKYWDWKVTIAFYASLHLVNAHLAKTINAHYQKHSDTNNAINFSKPLSLSKVNQQTYVAYRALQNLSRRARYLINENSKNADPSLAFFTYEKHYAKALRHLDKLLIYFTQRYKELQIDKIKVHCVYLKEGLQFVSLI